MRRAGAENRDDREWLHVGSSSRFVSPAAGELGTHILREGQSPEAVGGNEGENAYEGCGDDKLLDHLATGMSAGFSPLRMRPT